MIARLRTKPGSDRIKVTQGSFADVPVEGEFALVYVVFNTFFALVFSGRASAMFSQRSRASDEAMVVL